MDIRVIKVEIEDVSSAVFVEHPFSCFLYALPRIGETIVLNTDIDHFTDVKVVDISHYAVSTLPITSPLDETPHVRLYVKYRTKDGETVQLEGE